jgi:MFS family permease
LAFGIWGGIAGASAAFGPIVGGYFATNYSWRWGFRLNVFVCLALILGSFIIKESRDTAEKKMIDWVGVLLSSIGLLTFVFGVIESSDYGWWKAKQVFEVAGNALTMPFGLSITPYAMALGAIIIGVFLWWEQKVVAAGKTPLVRLSNFRVRQFSTSVFTTTVMGLGQTGLFFTLPVFLQSVQGLNPLQTGVALLPLSLTILIVAPLVAVVSSKIRPKYLILAGLAANTGAFFLLRMEMTATATAADLRPGLIVFGLGMGLVMSQITNMTMSALSAQESGEASGINNTMRQVGASLGSAIIGAILLSTLSTNLANGVNASTVIPEPLKPTLSEAVSKQTSNVEFSGGAQIGTKVPPAITAEIQKIGHQATADANRTSLLFGAAFAFMGFLSALLLPNIKGAEHSRKEDETVTGAH